VSHTRPGDNLNDADLPIDLRQEGDTLLVPLQVKPSARKIGVLGVHDGRLKIAVSAAPEKGKANQDVVRLIAKLLGVSRSAIEIRTGATSPKKVVAVTGVSRERFSQQVAGAIGGEAGSS